MNVITVNKRDLTVKAKQLRRSGMVPGSVFGGPLTDSISLQIDEATVRKLFREKREGSKLKIDLDGKLILVQIKEKAVNTLSNEILHISFQALKADRKVNSVIHILLKNTEKVTESLEKALMEIPYAALPEDMIDTITIDVDGMAAGSVITVVDIPELESEKIDLQV
ncbi:MAG: 50S ribosomal protein L25/general stress protein Ctc, partial [Oscillospiraceae bacterium]|nr:50S ribosomal protein L25/general stress protein Ctc [Oscillospiraceae bacterium]